jgi:cytochrome c554/c'-like protein
VRLKTDDVLRMGARCQKCHQQEYAEWAAGPHSATTDGKLLLEQLGLSDRLRHPKLAEQPAIFCLACQAERLVHDPFGRPETATVHGACAKKKAKGAPVLARLSTALP